MYGPALERNVILRAYSAAFCTERQHIAMGLYLRTVHCNGPVPDDSTLQWAPIAMCSHRVQAGLYLSTVHCNGAVLEDSTFQWARTQGQQIAMSLHLRKIHCNGPIISEDITYLSVAVQPSTINNYMDSADRLICMMQRLTLRAGPSCPGPHSSPRSPTTPPLSLKTIVQLQPENQ
jgi:hypothetical protein